MLSTFAYVIIVAALTAIAIQIVSRLNDTDYDNTDRLLVIGWSSLLTYGLLEWVKPEMVQHSSVVLIEQSQLNEPVMAGPAPF